jgi:GMP synthase (glutamine-hydrolysing)
MKLFVLLQTRPEEAAADNEYEAFMKFSGLDPVMLRRYRIHAGGLPKLKLDGISGVFIGGGPYCVTTRAEDKSSDQEACEADIERVLSQADSKVPILAACFIGPVIAHYGGQMDRAHPEVIGGREMSLSGEGKTDQLLAGLPDKFKVFTGHKESVSKLPEKSVVLSATPSCPYQMIRIGERIYACQFHPELDSEGLALRVQIYKNSGYYPPEDADKLISEAVKHDVSQPVKILRKFVQVYQK